MGVKETILDLLNRLSSISVSNQDTNTVSMYSALWNNQIERKKEGTGYVYKTPASFLEMQFSEGVPIGLGATSYEVKFVIMLEHEHYNTEGSLDQDLIIFDLIDKAHRVLNGYKPANCSPLYKSGKTLDYNHDNTYLATLEYSSHFIDLTGSAHDDLTGAYLIETLTNPRLTIEETIYIGVMPSGGGGSVYSLSGNVTTGYGNGMTIWRDGVGIPDDSIGYNGDYYLDTLSGDIYSKVAGVYVFKMTLSGGGGGGGGITNFVVQTDNNFSLANGTGHILTDNLLTTNRTVDVSALTTECEIYNGRQGYSLTFTGGTVYRSGGSTVETEVMSEATTHLRKVGSKIMIIN